MNWATAAAMMFCEAIACWAAWCPPEATAPGGPHGLLFLTTCFCLAWPIYLYREDNKVPMRKEMVANPFFEIADVVRKDGEVAKTVDCKICGERLYDIDAADAKDKWKAIPAHFNGHGRTVIVYS